jgi:hypothetical protein
MKKLFFAALLLFCLAPKAQNVDQTFYIDFGENNVSSRGNLTSGADKFGHYWTNVYSTPSERCYPADWKLVNSENAETDYVLGIGTYFHTNGMTGGGGLLSPDADLLGDLAVPTATQDYIHVEGFQDYNVIHFWHLDKSKAYRFSCFGSRVVADDRGGTFEFHGENFWSDYMQMSGAGIGAGGYNGNNNRIIVSDPIFPDKDGHIALVIVKKYKTGMVYLNCMKIEELSGLTRPNAELSLTQKMLIDFGETNNNARGHQTVGADINGNYWNNLSSGIASSNQIPKDKSIALVNTANSATGFTMTTLTGLETNGVNAGGLANPKAEYLGDLAVTTATEDYVWIYDTSTRSISFSGLDPNKCYKFYIFGSRATSESDRRISFYQVSGQTDWSTNLVTSGTSVGGNGVQGNNRNVAISDYIYPNADGTIVFSCRKNTDFNVSHAHFNAIKIEEYSGGVRPADPLVLTTAVISGSAAENGSDVTMKELKPNGTPTGIFECYQKLQAGTYYIKGVEKNGSDITLGHDAEGKVVKDGAAFEVTEPAVVRMRYDSKSGELTVLPVELYVRGNIAPAGTKVGYAGNGVFCQDITLDDSGVFLFSDKYIYFAFNNKDDLAVKRLSGSRTAVAMPSEGFSAENIRINGGKYTLTLDMNNYSWDVSAPIDEYKISAFGSSVCNGQGATGNKGYAYLYGVQLGQRYKGGISANPFTVSGVAIGGNTTINLLDRYDEMIHDFGKYVIIGLSMGNEGIHGAANQQGVFNQFRDNMLKLIDKMKADGKTVVLMNNYTRGDYTPTDYEYIKRMNILIHQWDVASVNTLGAIDNGQGKWADGFEADPYHPTTAGHRQFMTAIPTSLFDALEQGKPQPERDMQKSVILENGSTISFSGESVVNPYTLSIRIRGTEDGTLMGYSTLTGKEANVSVVDGGYLQYTSAAGKVIKSKTPVIIDKDKWYNITITNYFAQKRTLLYCDRTCIGEISERLMPSKFFVGDSSRALHREYSELSFWRSAMNNLEINNIVSGKMLKSSLDIYSPLSDDIKTGKIENLAQSLNEAHFVQGDVADDIKETNVSSGKKSKFYALTGISLPAPKQGVNIERREDGSSRSILIEQ